MKKLLKILTMLILIQLLLVSYAFVSPRFSIPLPYLNNDRFEMRFPALGELLDFRFSKASPPQSDYALLPLNLTMRDTMSVARLLLRKPLSFSQKEAINTYMTNPEAGGNRRVLDDFFEALHALTDSTSIRVAHYGDSQLEGDRLTSVLRDQFQERFGGTGIGYVPITDITSHMQLLRNQSSNWNRHTVFKNEFYSTFYGAAGLVFNFLNSSFGNQHKKESAFVTLSLYSKVHYQKLYVLYGQALSNCDVVVRNHASNQILYSTTLKASKGFVMQELPVGPNHRQLGFTFSGVNSPSFYGFLFDGDHGVQVDNYAIRGHSGDGLLKINTNYLAEQFHQMNTRLLIFQFGANVVPYITSEAKLKKFEQGYYDLLVKYKQAMPDMSILVVSTGDMAMRENGQYASYPYLPAIRDAQKRAALKAGCAFWDLFSSMGGTNSIIDFSDNLLATRDGHFTKSGQQEIGTRMFSALMSEYNYFLYKQRTRHLVSGE